MVGKFELKKGQKITAAVGQQSQFDGVESGGSFLVLETDEKPKLLLAVTGARAGTAVGGGSVFNFTPVERLFKFGRFSLDYEKSNFKFLLINFFLLSTQTRKISCEFFQ